MRTADFIHETWEAAFQSDFVGEKKPHTIVTVEDNWQLNLSKGIERPDGNIALWERGPLRWFQSVDPSLHEETIVPNVQSVNIQRSVDVDSATMSLVMRNQRMDLNDEVLENRNDLGSPGYYSFSHGESADARSRWDHIPNEWADVLVPNALLRTYQGFGGHDKSLEECLEDGNLILTGMWLIDTIGLSATGEIQINCRDMGKLLIDQQLYPPLVPNKLYPLKYCRWEYRNVTINNSPITTTTPGSTTEQQATYGCTGYGSVNTGNVLWYPPDGIIHGHAPWEILDNNMGSYWLSVGNHSPSAPYAVEYIEICTGGAEVNVVYVHPMMGNYQMMVSVWENGGWVAPEAGGQGGMVSYDPLHVGRYTGANTAVVPFVSQYGVPWETAQEYVLPRTYKADKIRFTFTNLQNSGIGAYPYRAGVREIRARNVIGATQTTILPYMYTCAPYPNLPNAEGYIQVRNDGAVYAFGDARKMPKTSANSDHTKDVVAANMTHTGNGYYTMDDGGKIVCYGDAEHFGDQDGQGGGYKDFAITPSGNGYWILRNNGVVYEFGDAEVFGDSTIANPTMPSGAPTECRSIESHPDDQGFWVLQSDGTVTAHNLTNHGSANRAGFERTEYVNALRRTSTGDGYWIVSGSGKVQDFGDAEHFGNATENLYPESEWHRGLIWDFIPGWLTDGGYALQRADGQLDVFGDFELFGSYKEGIAILRETGNYEDYTDIVKELVLWSGWLLHDPDATNSSDDDDADTNVDTRNPPVYGNMEDTGAFASECLPEEMFDKRPVIDAINEIKEIVGYMFWVDMEGRVRFETPNWWQPGNYDELGEPVDRFPVIDESVNMTAYSAGFTDASLRSEIIISTVDPTEDYTDTLTVRLKPFSSDLLRNMVKPAMWVNGSFASVEEMEILAELIALHIWFAQRTGSVSCVYNPAIEINDQIRIYERTTAETYIHYIRGITSTHDLQSGEFSMELETHWLGDQDNWAIVELGELESENIQEGGSTDDE